jgi:hypothetical protein
MGKGRGVLPETVHEEYGSTATGLVARRRHVHVRITAREDREQRAEEPAAERDAASCRQSGAELLQTTTSGQWFTASSDDSIYYSCPARTAFDRTKPAMRELRRHDHVCWVDGA